MVHYDAAAIRQRLEADRQRLEDDIYQRTEGDEAVIPSDPISDSGGTRGHSAEEAGAMADAERSDLVLGNSRTLLEQVRAALQRLDDGTYGFCQRCGKPIEARRLEALPYAEYDLECQEIVERETTREESS
ncbi:MAG TPA: TraR/DksA C4-type zinc finger protein [Ktedonobacterales bacterium]|jgi:RNA polymerase-binding transcription factor|nr:TraR/DksA C4-type zinc finger protein [Ktedonobacterales bacterium]